jgi:tetratricopeptide (TPR) repeat protein
LRYGDLDNDGGFAAFGKVSFALKKYDDAIFAYKKALELNPHHEEAMTELASVFTQFLNATQRLLQFMKFLPLASQMMQE